jgi:two-component system sensor histidine kinase CpxA
VRKLGQVVERFGSGDFAVRANSRRRDEFGDLAAAFNVMADRIETLLTAERRLLQDVSHELRSPLARLQFAVELARTSPDREQSFARINKEIDRLSKLVSELLLVTRAESDPASREMGEVALEELLRDVAEDSEVEAQAGGCELRVAANAPAIATGNEELLRRAFENVLRNAIRFAPAGTAVDVRLEAQAGTALVTVRDYGPGAPEEALQELCKPFFRVETDRNRNSGGGVGLGLAIAERAIKIHGGGMQVKNAHPGLMVTMELPVNVASTVTPVS